MRIRSFAGVIPPALVPAVRNIFTAQGIAASAVDDQGNIDPQAILALAYKEVEFRTRLGLIRWDARNLEAGAGRQLLQQLQLAIIGIDRQGGRTVLFAPYGIPAETSGASRVGVGLGIGAGAALLGLLLVGAAVLGPKLRG